MGPATASRDRWPGRNTTWFAAPAPTCDAVRRRGARLPGALPVAACPDSAHRQLAGNERAGGSDFGVVAVRYSRPRAHHRRGDRPGQGRPLSGVVGPVDRRLGRLPVAARAADRDRRRRAGTGRRLPLPGRRNQRTSDVRQQRADRRFPRSGPSGGDLRAGTTDRPERLTNWASIRPRCRPAICPPPRPGP